MSGLRINLDVLAKSYGLDPPVKGRILVDWLDHGSDLLLLDELEPQVAIDLDTIRAIGEMHE